jgi:hypothetical protein
MDLSNMCKIAHDKTTKSSKYLLQSNKYIFKNYTFNIKDTSFQCKLTIFNLLTCTILHMIDKL